MYKALIQNGMNLIVKGYNVRNIVTSFIINIGKSYEITTSDFTILIFVNTGYNIITSYTRDSYY